MDLLHNTYGSFRRSDSYKRHATLFSFRPAREQQHQPSISDSIKVKWNFNSVSINRTQKNENKKREYLLGMCVLINVLARIIFIRSLVIILLRWLLLVVELAYRNKNKMKNRKHKYLIALEQRVLLQPMLAQSIALRGVEWTWEWKVNRKKINQEAVFASMLILCFIGPHLFIYWHGEIRNGATKVLHWSSRLIKKYTKVTSKVTKSKWIKSLKINKQDKKTKIEKNSFILMTLTRVIIPV